MKILTVKDIGSYPEQSQVILNASLKNMGFVPNLYSALAYLPQALEAYKQLSELFSQSGLSPLEQQIVLITVSRENNCRYCVAAHSAISKMSKLDEQIIKKLRDGHDLGDEKLNQLNIMTKRIVSSKGWPDQSDIEKFFKVGYESKHLLAIILGLSLKTISNYTNHIAQTELDNQFKNFSWER